MDNDQDIFKPPYMSFQTWWKFTGELASKPLPPRIDRSLMSSKSGTDQSNLVAAMLSFGMITATGETTPTLSALAENTTEEERKLQLRQLLQHYYPRAVAVSEANDTVPALNRVFEDDFGLASPETRRKSVTFFLHALKTADMTYSAHFPKTRPGSGAPGTPKRTAGKRAKREKPEPVGEANAVTESSADEPFITVRLETGGTMMLSVSVNPLSLRGSDRTFFYDVVDKLSDYADAHQGADQDHPADDGTGL